MSAQFNGPLSLIVPVQVQFKSTDIQAFVQIAVPPGGLSQVTFQASMDGGLTWYDVAAQDILLGTTVNSYPLSVTGPADGSVKAYFIGNLGMFANAFQVVCNSSPGPLVQGRTGSFFAGLPSGGGLGSPSNLANLLFAILLTLDQGLNTNGAFLDLTKNPPTPATTTTF